MLIVYWLRLSRQVSVGSDIYEFLGHFVGGGRISPSDSKVQAVCVFVPPIPLSRGCGNS